MPFLNIHPAFLIVLLVIVLIIFGPGKLPEMGSAIGRSIREFRKTTSEITDEVKSAIEPKDEPPAPAPVVTATATEPEAAKPATTEKVDPAPETKK
jgi:sec-independent protein translocase protein TatA